MKTQKQLTDRESTITQILACARRQCPEIVESFQLKFADGNWYSFGAPWGVHSTGERRSVGFVFRDRLNGTTYGIRHESEQAARDSFNAREDANQADFRVSLEDSTDERLAEKLAFWLGEKAKADRLAGRTPTKQLEVA